MQSINELAALFHVHEKASGHPKLKPIADAVMKELEGYAEGLVPKPEPQPEPEPEVQSSEEDQQPQEEVDLRHDRETATRR